MIITNCFVFNYIFYSLILLVFYYYVFLFISESYVLGTNAEYNFLKEFLTFKLIK